MVLAVIKRDGFISAMIRYRKHPDLDNWDYCFDVVLDVK